MTKIKKVSFDYDNTLSKKEIQEQAKKFVEAGFEVHCTTRRYSCGEPAKYKMKGAWYVNDNKDLFETCKEVGIKKEHIHFTNDKDKDYFFKNNDFLFHLDDDIKEIFVVNRNTKTLGVWYNEHYNWYRDLYLFGSY